VNSQTYTAGQTATIANVGTLRINSGGGYTFIPVANYNGTVPTATYTITDGALTDFATLLITVNAVNDIPIAVNDVNAVYEDASLNVAASGVLSNDTDPEGNTLTVASIRKGGVEGSGTAGTLGAALTGTYGDLTLNTNGSYTYVANNANSLAAGATVTDVFNYTISDGNGGTDIATLTITITGTNDAPIAVNDVNSIYQGVTLKVINGSANDLLNNDSDPDNDPITITQFVVNGVTKSAGQTATISGVGSLKINADGSYTFTPTISFNGTVPTVTYTISDGYSTDNATLIITVIPDSDGDGIADNIDIDDDNDGITDLNESGGVDPLADADSDGTPNYRDQTPGSGLPTWVDTNADGINDKYDADLDGIINSIDLDSDNDGVPDLLEAGGVDTDGDGRIDSTTDTDGDGLMNPYDASTGGDNIVNDDRDGDGVKNYLDLDSDNDGIPDVIESGGTDSNNDGKIDGYTDTDGDGFAQSVDGDSNNDGTAENTANALIITGTDGNNDGVPDSWPRANNDGNGFPNAYDLDADGDGILDAREAGMPDADNNGIADGTLGADGWSNTVDELSSLNLTNTDGHGNPDYLDIDSDNDGIVDNIEAQSTADYIAPSGADNDGDGIDNAYDNNDYTFGGNEDNGLTPVNTDKTDNPDYRDLDTDNDGRDDRLEGWDTDGNGTIEGNEVAYLGLIDLDNDGLFEKYDSNDNLIDPTNGGARPTSYPDVVNVGQDRDWREALSTLPVELYSQEAKLIDQYAVVSWATASETNNDYFVVEKSSDNHSFELVERIGGAGNSNVLIQYQSVDFEPYKGVSYYRITQVDYDGKDETFPTMVINNKHNTQMSFTAFPNPASDQVDILSSEGGMISIYNSTGVNVYQASIEANVKQTINVRDLNPGVYMIQIQHSTGMEIKKLMVK
jgi:VCBS repeat-containing protein